ncbi:hypothetical protein D3C83_107040 [compost metagenome]
MGIFHGAVELDPNVVVERELAVVGCSAFAGELPQAIARLPELAGDLRKLIEREIGLEDVPDAYRRLIRGEAAGLKTIIRAP